MPLFALANAGVPLDLGAFGSSVALAVAAGLVVGKPLGIVAFSWLAVRLRIASLPLGVGWSALLGAGALAGIGFTMALFIAELALAGPFLVAAKLGTLSGSAVAAALGLGLLAWLLPADEKSLPRGGARGVGCKREEPEMERFRIWDAGRLFELDASIVAERVALTPASVEAQLGWELSPRACAAAPCACPCAIARRSWAGGIDLAALARAARPAARARRRRARRRARQRGGRAHARALATLEAPDFALPDLLGRLHRSPTHRGKKVLLIAYASW